MLNVNLVHVRENGGAHRPGAEEGNGVFLCSILSFLSHVKSMCNDEPVRRLLSLTTNRLTTLQLP